ncbi:MAG: hypothetical protein A3K68_07560 [Euryarchaeota archaeon RBG_16_68_13]|nr:MAG: hypothetical protein A3K68_07560 [Euryarchaeota archaeon RBG_16_68_13]
MADVRGSRGVGTSALPLSVFSLAFSAIALPIVYVLVPFCRPEATALDLIATVGVASLSSALALAGVLLSLLSVYTARNTRSRTSLALATGSLAIATAFIVFGLALRSCAA